MKTFSETLHSSCVELGKLEVKECTLPRLDFHLGGY